MSKFADEERTVRNATQITMLVENFRKYNLQWAPSDSTGQEYTYKDGIEYHQMCLGVLTEKQKARNERYGDYDEDEDEDELSTSKNSVFVLTKNIATSNMAIGLRNTAIPSRAQRSQSPRPTITVKFLISRRKLVI